MNPFDLTDAELEDLADVTPEDVAEAVAFWEAHAPEDDKGLIEAVPPAKEGDE